MNAAANRAFTWRIAGRQLFVAVTSRGAHKVDLVNASGRAVASYKGIGAADYTFPATIASGVYLLRVTTDKLTVTKISLLHK